MSKVTHRDNYRVEILPAGGAGSRDANELADYLAEVMKRDKGLADLVFTIRVCHDADHLCEFCRNTWEVDENGEPACCDRAQEEWRADKQIEVLEAVTDRIAEVPDEEITVTRIHAGTVHITNLETGETFSVPEAVMQVDRHLT